MTDNRATSIESVAQNILKQATNAKVNGRPYIIGLAGGSASGKTTLANLLLEELGTANASILSQDNFQLGWDFPHAESSPYRWDDPRHFAPDEVLSALKGIRENKTVQIPTFDLKPNRRTGTRTIEPKKFLIFEGLYALAPEFHQYLDDSVFITLPFYGRFLRRVFRYQKDVDSGRGDITVRHMLTFVRAAHQVFVRSQIKNAAKIANAHYNFDMETAKSYQLEKVARISSNTKPEREVLLPCDIRLCTYQSMNSEPQFAILWRSQEIFRCTVENKVVQGFADVSDWNEL